MYYTCLKQVIVCIILIFLNIEAFSQKRFPEAGTPRRRNQIYVPLTNHNHLFVSFNHWHELEEHSNIDSLLHLFKHDWNTYKASALFSSADSKVLYTIESNGHRTIRSINKKTRFRVAGDSLIPYGRDTLIIEKQIKSLNKLSLPEDLRLYFILNDFDELLTIDSVNNFIQQAKNIAANHPRKNVFNPRYLSFVTLDTTSSYPVSARAYSSMPRKMINLGIGTGLAQNQLYSSFSGEFTLLPELKRTGVRLRWDEYFHFHHVSTTSPVINRSSFISLGVVFFNPWPGTLLNFNAPPEKGGLMLGYMVRKNGNFFPNDTWRLSTRIKLIKPIAIEPEIYWNGLFKNVYPGLRLNVSFFTNI